VELGNVKFSPSNVNRLYASYYTGLVINIKKLININQETFIVNTSHLCKQSAVQEKKMSDLNLTQTITLINFTCSAILH
jgi:predicted nucleic-acid-binding Zn-ribbon protein